MSKGIKIDLKNEIDLTKDFKPSTYQEWRGLAEKDLKGKSFEQKLISETYEGIRIDPVYQEKKSDDLPSFPGMGDYKRGCRVGGYLSKKWGLVQNFEIMKDPFTLNKTIKDEIERGLGIIKITLSGSEGFSNFNLQYLKNLFNGINLSKHPIIFSGNHCLLEFLIFFLSFLEEENINIRDLEVMFIFDPLACLVQNGELPLTINKIFDQMAMALKLVEDHRLNFRLIGIDGTPYHKSGASIVQQSVYMVSTAIFYLDQMLQRGLNIETVAKNLNFNLEISPFFFMEVANIRALRMVWGKLIKAFNGSKDAQKIFLNAKSSFYFQTLLDPYVNILRATTESFSAIIAGVETLQVDGFSKCFSLRKNEDEFARRVARNTQLIIREECHLDRLIDPAAGSYFLEQLTEKLAREILSKFKEIEAKGGIVEGLKKGFIQQEVKNLAKKRELDLKTRKNIVVGTNKYANLSEEIKAPQIQPKFKKHLRNKPSEEYKNLFDKKQVTNLIMNQNYGELSAVGKKIFSTGISYGQFAENLLDQDITSIPYLPSNRLTKPFEELRLAVHQYQEQTGKIIEVFLVPFGSPSESKPLVDFARELFETAGLKVFFSPGIEKKETTMAKIIQAKPSIVVICSSNDHDLSLVDFFVPQVKKNDQNTKIVLTVHTVEDVNQYQGKGIDEFIFQEVDMIQILLNLLKEIGVLS